MLSRLPQGLEDLQVRARQAATLLRHPNHTLPPSLVIQNSVVLIALLERLSLPFPIPVYFKVAGTPC